MFKNVYPREKYIKKLRPFYSSDIIKVITGIRRCGKSFILKGIINELLNIGVIDSQIIYIPLDRRGFKNIKTAEQLLKPWNLMMFRQDRYIQEELFQRYLRKM